MESVGVANGQRERVFPVQENIVTQPATVVVVMNIAFHVVWVRRRTKLEVIY
jgi:hypothetical protein